MTVAARGGRQRTPTVCSEREAITAHLLAATDGSVKASRPESYPRRISQREGGTPCAGPCSPFVFPPRSLLLTITASRSR
jgi:hypothetical protein